MALIHQGDNVNAAPILPQSDIHGAARASILVRGHVVGEGAAPHAVGVRALVQHQLHERGGGYRGSGTYAQAPTEEHSVRATADDLRPAHGPAPESEWHKKLFAVAVAPHYAHRLQQL